MVTRIHTKATIASRRAMSLQPVRGIAESHDVAPGCPTLADEEENQRLRWRIGRVLIRCTSRTHIMMQDNCATAGVRVEIMRRVGGHTTNRPGQGAGPEP